MHIKGSEILNKLLGSGLLLASVGFFSQVSSGPEYIVPGLLFGAGGFWLAIRRERRTGPELDVQQKLEQLSEGLTATQQELAVTQDRLDRLSEERDFMRQLATPPREARPQVAADVTRVALPERPQSDPAPPAS